jgi:hypothetical protein
LRLLWEAERFDRIVVPAGSGGHGFTSKDLTWVLDHAPAETLVLKPLAEPVGNARQDHARLEEQ